MTARGTTTTVMIPLIKRDKNTQTAMNCHHSPAIVSTIIVAGSKNSVVSGGVGRGAATARIERMQF